LPRQRFLLTGVFLGVVALALAVAWVIDPAPAETGRTGGPAPDFTVPLIGGGSFDLSDHLESDGRPLVLNLWASWCLPCREEIPEIDAFAAEHLEIMVLGVAVEDTEQAAVEFATELSPGYPLGIADAAFEAAYPRIGLPVTFVIASDGRVQEVFNGILDQQTLERLVFG
jgi:thiol-disulfide isomerase/thioredoxin